MGDWVLSPASGQIDTVARDRQTAGVESRFQKGPGKRRDDNKMEEACRGFESLFIYQMLKEMRATIPKTDLFGGGRAEETYTAMLDQQLSQELSRGGGVGLSGLLLHQLSGVNANRD